MYTVIVDVIIIAVLPRVARLQAQLRRPYVRCLSRSCILSKPVNVFSHLFTFELPYHSSFSVPNLTTIFPREPLLTGAKSRFSTDVSF